MQVKREQSQEEIIQKLQRQVDELTADNLFLQDQLARKEQFTAMIAHELRGPLSPIINYAQMISRYAATSDANSTRNEALKKQTSIIISQAWRMTRLVNDLLDVSRLSSGQFTLMHEACDLCTLVKETVDQLRPVAPYHTLVVEVPETSIIGNWDGGRLQQALGNLLDNATKYSDEHTTITVCVWTSPEAVHVSVHNQGASIPSDDTQLLFRPFTRLQSSNGREGSGLGLFITKSIIEAHGGTLQLEPNQEAANGDWLQGTTFSFNLPLHERDQLSSSPLNL
ncbi:MAG: HAMP domain-containing histidine kinase [Ktedonobacteraceae bacterium]|nr:HAMP domain-containing histidine kinase [Ktedonobacteraceae bacterium]MBV9712296.1 HAMP domain-containing histidine kinase [Ktedonobacteraceae bacterium]